MGAADPYLNGRWTQVLDPTRRKVAAEVYWRIRQSSSSVREYLSLHWKGNRDGETWLNCWGLAENVDITLQMAHNFGGLPAVFAALAGDDRLELWLGRLGAEAALIKTGDHDMYVELNPSKAPGDAHLLPDWSVQSARDLTKSISQQAARVKARPGGSSGSGTGAASSGTPAGTPLRRRGRRNTSTAAPAAAKAPAASSAGSGATPAGGRAKPQ